MKPNLLILSDINGTKDLEWFDFYKENLSQRFDIEFIDSIELAELDQTDKTQEEIHTLFVEGGIMTAANNLVNKYKKPCLVLAFSIGGSIAWNAALKGLSAVKVIAISSTRLRKEYQRPKCEIELYYGVNDMHRPMDEWFEAMELYPNLLPGRDHEMYQEEFLADKVTNDLLDVFEH